jgi:GAF domain-containing protein
VTDSAVEDPQQTIADLQRRLDESIAQQTATADVLRVISRSAFELQPVLETLVESAARLCAADNAFVYQRDDGLFRLAATYGFSADYEHFMKQQPVQPGRGTLIGRSTLEVGIVHIPDVLADPEYSWQESQARGGYRTMLGVPMLREGSPIGVFAMTRSSVKPFTNKQIELLQTFTDQAVIAIENARLFNEVQAKTRDLSEALQQRTATADVLKVISRSAFDLQAVLQTLIESAAKLCNASFANIRIRDGDVLRSRAFVAVSEDLKDFLLDHPVERERGHVVGRAFLTGELVHVPDVLSDPEYEAVERVRRWGYRAVLAVPMLREGRVEGMFSLVRPEPGSFADREIELVRTFADQALIAIENVRLFNETQEALQRQTATADILKVIASSPSDVQPVFQAIAERSNRLVNGLSTAVYSLVGDLVHLMAFTPVNPAADAVLQASFPAPLSQFRMAAVGKGETYTVVDAEVDFATLPASRELARLRGWRSLLGVPLHRDGEPIGLITVTRAEPGRFDDHHVQLLQTFADQAVIAIGNVRLFDEVQAKTRDLTQALTYQTGSANILRVIASSPTDVNPVLQAIVESACELCGAYDALVRLKDGDGLAFGAHHGPLPVSLESVPITENSTAGLAVIGQEPVHVHDLLSPEGDRFPHAQELARLHGERTILSVPLLRESESIGAIVIRRREVNPFTDKQIALLQTFSDQAVIAIGNVRLFEEVQAKTHDLSEALRYQTGSADILNVIASSPTDVKPVLQSIVKSACDLCDANDAVVLLSDGDHLYFRAHHGPIAINIDKWPISRDWSSGRAFIDRATVHVPDIFAEEARDFTSSRELSERSGAMGVRSVLAVPLLRENESIGAILLRRREMRPFNEKQIALLQTFADQAVIAIGNVHLFEEVQAKTRDLTESLEQQTATSEVLEVISSSPGELQPVFQKMLENATRVCGANFGTMNLWDGEKFHIVADHNIPAEFSAFRQRTPIVPYPGTTLAILAETRQVAQIDDIRESPAYRAGVVNVVAMADVAGARTLVVVPMLKEGELMGAITIFRQEMRPFTPKHIALVENFTKQAVIAIENTRLLKELRARTADLSESLEQQTATSEVLQVISSTPGDLEPVFKSMLENATRICGANFGLMNLYEEGSFRPVANYNLPAAYAAYLVTQTPFQPHQQSGLGTVARTHQVLHVADIRTLPAYLEGDPSVVAISDLAGARSYFVVPMLKENELIGAITIYRQEVKPFAEKQTEVVANFASQAVIAIENARLLNELRERTTELLRSLDDLRTAQDRLIQTEKLASLGQLTAGIAHEIKNPLNFVNNFSALSAELTDELNDVLKPVTLDRKVREEVDELTGLLKGNLEKVVQHGKRADSIVKNMLLHSREGSGEHRSADINSLLDESLNLAYHGARAEKGEFNITLQRDFDADAGTIELFPQEITRAFLNLIANGVYAATKRKTGDNEPGFEPTLRATTKNLGNTVEIRIRDNGTGIPAEVQEKMFNPFFTTKPAGEGTGLGLSMTHDIIVKQHGGRIDVATEPGQFTEFTIVLPRKRNLSGRDRGET